MSMASENQKMTIAVTSQEQDYNGSEGTETIKDKVETNSIR